MTAGMLKTCPHCAVEFDSEDLVGIEIMGQYDGISYWHHKGCGKEWCRFCDSPKGHVKGCYRERWEKNDE